MALTLKLDDIKPLLGAVGLGGDATPKPDAVAPPMPPAPPPPTPPQAGFSAYSADPRNQQTIANSLTMPGTPITPPNVPPSSPLSSAPVPPPALPGSRPSLRPFNAMSSIQPLPSVANPNMGGGPPALPESAAPNAQELTLKKWEEQNPDQVAKPMLSGRGKVGNILNFATAGLTGAAGGLKGDPTAGVRWISEQAANDRQIPQLNQQRYSAAVIQPEKDAAAIADTQSQTAQRNATANKLDATSDLMAPFTMTADQAKAINQPSLAGTQINQRDYAKLVASAGNNNASTANNAANNDTKKSIADAANERMKALSDAASKTKTLIAQMHDATSRSNNAASNATKGGGALPGGGFKVPADVTKRAALASNVNENADAVDQLITRRPDIIGSSGGRYTNIQQMIGSDDPDIHELGVRMHNIALASNGAHGVRAAGAIQKTEDELFNNFKSGPKGISGALKATKSSMQTFLNDEQNFATTGNRAGSGAPSTGGSYKQTASGPGGHKIGSNDNGNTWFDVQTGKKL